MWSLTLLLSTAMAGFFTWLPARATGRRLQRADLWTGPGLSAAVWLFAICVYSKPGLTVGFDAFRMGSILAMQLWACGCAAGLRLRALLPQKLRRKALVGLLALLAVGAELFVCNLNFFASHGYQPVDLRPYLQNAPAEGQPLLLDEAQGAMQLQFAGLDQPLYNLNLQGLCYTDETLPEPARNPALRLEIAATDEASSVVRQSWIWQVAARAPRSFWCNLDLSGNAGTLTLTALPLEEIYRRSPIAYTVGAVVANVPRPLCFSWVRCLVLFALLLAVAALRPGAAAWKQPYLTYRRAYRLPVLVCGLALGVLATLAPFADPINSGVATSFYSVTDWDGESRVTFTKHINDWQNDTAAQYGALAHSMLQGRLDLEKDPPAELAALPNPYDPAARNAVAPGTLWDAAYYQGRYYVYFGVVPCLLFQLPLEALTGIADWPVIAGMLPMAWLMIWAVFALVREALRRWFPQASAAAYLLACVGMVGSSQLYYMLMRPSVYEYAILCGAVLVLVALWQWMAAANTAPQQAAARRLHLAAGSLSMALVAGCRPQMVLFAALSLPILWPLYGPKPRRSARKLLPELVCFILPVLLVAAGLMWYNAARFGSPFDFGANYNLTSNDMTRRGFTVGRVAPALFTTFLAPAAVTNVFPFLQGFRMSTNYMGLTITELYYGGALACLPLLWSLVLWPVLHRTRPAAGDLRLVVAFSAAFAVLLTVLDCEMAGVLYRYQSDFLGPLLFVAVLLWLRTEQLLRPGALHNHVLRPLLHAWRAAFGLAVAAGIGYNFCVFFTAMPGLVGQNPALYQTVSRLVQFWL